MRRFITAGFGLVLQLVEFAVNAVAPQQFVVRALGDEPAPGALVLVAGRLEEHDPLQVNIHHVTDEVRRLFLTHGYDDDRIYYLATDFSLEGVDALPSAANLEAAITTWAVDKVGSDRAFTLYLMDHGYYDRFYLDGPRGEAVSPEEVAERLGVPKELVLREGVRLYLENELRNLRAEMEGITKRYGVSSVEELWRRVEEGSLTEEDCREDLMRLEYIEARINEVLRLLGISMRV